MIASLFALSRPILADGAMATNLFDRGLALGACPEGWTLSHPAAVEGLHRDFVGSGADILLTNSFGGHPRRLRAHGLADRAVELNHRAAVLARAAAAGAGRPVAVAGTVGPTGDAELWAGTAAGFALQMEALAAGGVDLFWIETMSFADEIRAAAEAAAALQLPYGLTASFGRDGFTRGGLDAMAFARLAAGLPVPPLAIGTNCGTESADVVRDLAALRAAAPHLCLVAKPNAGLPEMRRGRLRYPLTTAAMGAVAVRAVAAGAGIVGGCCGATPAHLAGIAAAVRGAAPLASAAKAS